MSRIKTCWLLLFMGLFLFLGGEAPGLAQTRPVKLIRLELKPLPLKKLKPFTERPSPPSGPDPARVLDLADLLEDQSLLQDLGKVTGFDPHYILQDKSAPHVFYYVPRAFLLLCDEAGYHLGVQYNYQARPGEPSVTLNMDLAAPFQAGDTRLLKHLLREGLKPPPGITLKVKALPALGAEVNLEALASGVALPAERLHVVLGAHLRKPLRLSMLLTPEEVEEVLTQLASEGLVGELVVGIGDKTIPIPLEIRFTEFAGPKVQGLEDWLQHKKQVKIRNLTYFPMRLQGLCAYRLQGSTLERYCRGVKGSLRPRQAVPLRIPPPEKVLGRNLLMVWFDFRLDTSCKECLARIQQEVRRGVSLTPTTILTWEVIPSTFEKMGLYKVVVELRSRGLSASGKETTKVLAFSPEETHQEVLLYLHEKQPRYLYRLQVVTQDGEQFRQEDWQESDRLTQIIGKKQLEEVLSSAKTP